MTPLILTVDRSMFPQEWVTLKRAAAYLAKGKVASVIGETDIPCTGGISRRAGCQTVLTANSILVLDGHNPLAWKEPMEPAFSKRLMFQRDRYMCAFCGAQGAHLKLTCDHLRPQSRGGANSFMNCVTSCKSCNQKKGARTPEEAHMPLLYLPYVPSRFETLILSNRNILVDQMDFLMHYLPDNSRLKLS